MPIGPGKYDEECVKLLKETEADTVLILVLGGKRGSGFSTAAKGLAGLLGTISSIKILRDVADGIESDLANPVKHDA